MITLHGTTLSNYYNKVKLALLEKGLPFTEVPQRVRSTDEAVLAASPLGKVPFVRVDGQSLCESQVIVDFLEARFPAPPLVPADPLAAAKVREVATFLELYVELPARELYMEAFFGGRVSDEVKASVRERLERGLPAWRRLARFSPYGEDLVAAAGIDWKGYLKRLGERPSVQRVNADRKRDLEAQAAARG